MGGATEGAWLLTGATDGIGLALARRWSERGLRPWLSGRRAVGDLDPSLFPPERYLRADLARSDGPRELADRLAACGVRSLKRAVLNAGVGWFGAVGDQDEGSVRELTAVNLTAPIELTHRLLPLLERGRGRLCFVSSVVTALPAPEFAAYTATKAALEGFARSLRSELGDSVEVQVVRPGATRTAMHAKSGVPSGRMDTSRFPAADAVAADLDAALSGPPRWRTLGAGNRLVRFAGRALPRVVDRMQERACR